MFGLEVVGIAARIIQIADLGTNLSVTLFSFYRQVQNVDRAIQHLSSDVALTCAILRELGNSLKQGGQSKLCSSEAHLTSRQMLKQYEEVLRQIQQIIDDSLSCLWQVSLAASDESNPQCPERAGRKPCQSEPRKAQVYDTPSLKRDHVFGSDTAVS